MNYTRSERAHIVRECTLGVAAPRLSCFVSRSSGRGLAGIQSWGNGRPALGAGIEECLTQRRRERREEELPQKAQETQNQRSRFWSFQLPTSQALVNAPGRERKRLRRRQWLRPGRHVPRGACRLGRIRRPPGGKEMGSSARWPLGVRGAAQVWSTTQALL